MSASTAQKVDPAHATLWARHYPGHDMIGYPDLWILALYVD
jgi:cytochrome o ubiquinol oxidase subunit 3